MTTKTDYEALMQIERIYKPTELSPLTEQEAATIREVLELETRNDLELKNILFLTSYYFADKMERSNC